MYPSVQIAYATVCLFFALANALEIKKNRRIYHGLNGALHLAIVGSSGAQYSWGLAICMLFVGRLCFDTALNLFRGLPLDYVPDAPKSVVDRLEKRVFGEDGLTPKALYLDIIILFNLIPYVS